MLIKNRKYKSSLQALTLGLSLILLSTYFLFSISSPTYIGILTKKNKNTWKISKIHSNGSAKDTGLEVNDIIVSIDEKKPDKNKLLNKWLIVEQVESIVIRRNGEIKKFYFIKNYNVYYQFLYLLLVTFSLFLFSIWYRSKIALTKKARYFYYFLVCSFFFLLSITLSSIGNPIARILIIMFISILPIFLNLLTFKQNIFSVKYYIFFSLFILNFLLSILNILFNLPPVVINYLVSGIFYLLFIELLIIVFMYFFQKKNIYSVNILCSFPFLFGYMFEIWSIPLVYSILFLFFPVIIAFIELSMKKNYLFKYKFSHKLVQYVSSLFLLALFSCIFFLTKSVPIYIVSIYSFFLIYNLIPIFIDVSSIAIKAKNLDSSIETFIIAEEERENISLFIHDTIIQDIIFHIRNLKEMNKKKKDSTILILEDTVYLLREICSDIYPLLIEEIGLEASLIELTKQLIKNILLISHTNLIFNVRIFQTK